MSGEFYSGKQLIYWLFSLILLSLGFRLWQGRPRIAVTLEHGPYSYDMAFLLSHLNAWNVNKVFPIWLGWNSCGSNLSATSNIPVLLLVPK